MDAGVISFTMANPGYSLRFHTHWLSPPVPALALSGGPRKRTGCPTIVKDYTRASGRAWQQIEGAPINSGLRLNRDGLTQILAHVIPGHRSATAGTLQHKSIELRVWEPRRSMCSLASDLAGARPEMFNYTA